MTANVATLRTVSDLVAEYDAKNAAMDDAVSAFEAAKSALEKAATVWGTYGGNSVIDRSPDTGVNRLRSILLRSGWQAMYDRLSIERVASATDKAKFQRALANPPPLTVDNVRATFGDYLLRPRFHVLKGLAECFVWLDPAYKSHSKVKIGVSGLPKRVIISGFGEYGYGHGYDRLRDILNALAAYRGEPLLSENERNGLYEDLRTTGECDMTKGRARVVKGWPKDEEQWLPARGVRVVRFGNGNGHIHFDSLALTDINKALAEFYGEVLPDAEDNEAARPKKRASTEVSKDLQYYPTPRAVVDTVLSAVGIGRKDEYAVNYRRPIYRVLEPSCGCGRFLDEIRERGHVALGVEFDPARAQQSRANGHAVITGNFLEKIAAPEFDLVVMNPPFYGRHYLKHLTHALGYLKPDGRLACILPASAWYDNKKLLPLEGYRAEWSDLPVASFAESGTNVPTGYLIMRRAA